VRLCPSRGTKERYYCPCPFCGGKQTLDFKNLKYQTINNNNKILIKDSVYYECIFCKGNIRNAHKQQMLIKGEWIADNKDADFPSYRLNALYSPWISFEKTISEYLESLEDIQRTKTFYNTYLGEIYEADSKILDPKKIIERSKKIDFLKEIELDSRIICLTGAVDTQDNRLCIDIKGWGKGEECWTVLYKEIQGNLNEDNVWNQIREIVYRDYKHPAGINLNIQYCAIDAGGHFTQKVYDFASRNSKFKVVRGSNHKQTTLLSVPRKQNINYKGTFKKDGIETYTIGTEIAKEEIYYRLKIEQEGIRYIHFNLDLDERYFDMLTSEKLVTKYVNGFPEKKWVKKNNDRNESLDTFVYNYAIARGLCHIDLLDDIMYEKKYKEIFGDYGVLFFEKEKTQEDLDKEKIKKKEEMINKINKKESFMNKTKRNSSNGGFMSGFKK